MEADSNIKLVENVSDDKNIITDIAFGVDDALLGKKLARPWQRGIAIAIDAFLVLLLTDVGGVFWGFVAGIAIFKFGKKNNKQKRWRLTRYLLRVMGAFAVFVSIVVFLGENYNDDQVDKTQSGAVIGEDVSLTDSIKLGTLIYALSNKLEQPDCDLTCYNPLIEDTLSSLVKLNIPSDDVLDIIKEHAEKLPIESEEERLEYVNQLFQYYKVQLAQTKSNQMSTDQDETDQAVPTVTENSLEQKQSHLDTTIRQPLAQMNQEPEATKKPVYSIVELFKGIIADLGLGFGWAALYFTAFPAWWRGQTPGKRLMGIRVIQLDGTYMSAWDSFGRYGGYGAGFATGLLGFLQIYWDSNRQAIHDKISATVVIKGDI